MASYGGGGFDQFAGGGFMPTQQEAGVGGGGSGGKGRTNREQTLRAVTVRQLITAVGGNASEQEIVLDGFDLSNVTLVGRVANIAERGSNIELQLSDGTGVVDVDWYLDSDDPTVLAEKRAELRPGTYVRVYGHLRFFNGAHRVQAFVVRAIHNYDEITYHLLQAIFQHLHLQKGGGTGTGAPPQQQGGYGGGGGGMYGGPAAGGWQAPPQQQQQQQHAPQGGYGGGAPAAGGAPAHDGMDPCHSAVLAVISDPNIGENGLHVNDICTRLAHQGFNRPQVEGALSFLQNEAHAYTTCDEFHWRPT